MDCYWNSNERRERKRKNAEIERQLQKDRLNARRETKILLLGKQQLDFCPAIISLKIIDN